MKYWAVLFLTLATTVSVWAGDAPWSLSVLETNALLIRAGEVSSDFSDQFQAIISTNKISGMILDLRFDSGDSGALASVLKEISGAKMPLMILVNGETRGAAAKLVAQWRAEKKCLVIGSTNEPGKISPDIAVNASAAEEKIYQANPFADLNAEKSPVVLTNDFLPFIDHTSEAELVRERVKDGEEDDSKTPRAAAPEVIHDPALARAMDLIKALAFFSPRKNI